MLNKNMDYETISEISGKTIEEIKEIENMIKEIQNKVKDFRRLL